MRPGDEKARDDHRFRRIGLKVQYGVGVLLALAERLLLKQVSRYVFEEAIHLDDRMGPAMPRNRRAARRPSPDVDVRPEGGVPGHPHHRPGGSVRHFAGAGGRFGLKVLALSLQGMYWKI